MKHGHALPLAHWEGDYTVKGTRFESQLAEGVWVGLFLESLALRLAFGVPLGTGSEVRANILMYVDPRR